MDSVKCLICINSPWSDILHSFSFLFPGCTIYRVSKIINIMFSYWKLYHPQAAYALESLSAWIISGLSIVSLLCECDVFCLHLKVSSRFICFVDSESFVNFCMNSWFLMVLLMVMVILKRRATELEGELFFPKPKLHPLPSLGPNPASLPSSWIQQAAREWKRCWRS